MKVYKYVKTWTDETTKKRRVVRADTEDELWRKYFNARYGSDDGIQRSVKVNEWFYKAVETYKTGIKDTTLYNYKKEAEKHVLPFIGELYLYDVKAADCQAVLNRLKGRSLRLISQVEQILNFIFTTAIYNNLTNTNPAQYLIKPKGKEKEKRRALYDDERKALKELFDGPNQERLRIFEIMYYCGCRPSEIFRMTKEDITEKKGVTLLHVRAGKTAAAERYIPIDETLVEKLRKQKGRYLVTTEAGNPLNNSTYRRIVKRLYRELDIKLGAVVYRNEIKESKLSPDFVPYCIRHDYCSRLKLANVDIRVAQYLMGHSNISVTSDIYTHTSETDIAKIGPQVISGLNDDNPWKDIQPVKF